jgi:hypothetical protein
VNPIEDPIETAKALQLVDLYGCCMHRIAGAKPGIFVKRTAGQVDHVVFGMGTAWGPSLLKDSKNSGASSSESRKGHQKRRRLVRPDFAGFLFVFIRVHSRLILLGSQKAKAPAFTGASQFNWATSYSPTHLRVQYHRG